MWSAVQPRTGASSSAALPALLAASSQGADGVLTDVVFTYDEIGALRDGTADVALMCQSVAVPGLELIELGPEQPVVLLPAGHPLADRPFLTLTIEATDHPRIRIQVLRFGQGAHLSMAGSVTVFSFPADADVAFIETMAGSIFLDAQRKPAPPARPSTNSPPRPSRPRPPSTSSPRSPPSTPRGAPNETSTPNELTPPVTIA